MQSRVHEAVQESISTEEFPCYNSYKGMLELNMSPFGRFKLSVIPEGVVTTVYNYLRNASKLPSYEKFLEMCIQHCKTANIDLKSRWSRFYAHCKLKGHDHEHLSPIIKRMVNNSPVPLREYMPGSEEDFWKVELDIIKQPEKWKTLDYIPNPWRKTMLVLEEIKQTDLYALYLDAHPYNIQDQDKLVIYHQSLASLSMNS